MEKPFKRMNTVTGDDGLLLGRTEAKHLDIIFQRTARRKRTRRREERRDVCFFTVYKSVCCFHRAFDKPTFAT